MIARRMAVAAACAAGLTASAGPALAATALFTEGECQTVRQLAQLANPEQDWQQPLGRFQPHNSQKVQNGFLASWSAVFDDGTFGLELARWSEEGFVGELQGQVLFAMACMDDGPKSLDYEEAAEGEKQHRIFIAKTVSGQVVQIAYSRLSPQSFGVQVTIGYPKR